MRKLFSAFVFVLSVYSAAVLADGYSTAESTIGTLLDNPVTAEILEKHMPGFTTNGQVSMTRPMTLTALQSFAPDLVTDEALALIDEELQALGN